MSISDPPGRRGARRPTSHATSLPARRGSGELEHVTVRPAGAARPPPGGWTGTRGTLQYRQVTCTTRPGSAPSVRTEESRSRHMPEAVIVATGRTPIGRAKKGSLVEGRAAHP